MPPKADEGKGEARPRSRHQLFKDENAVLRKVIEMERKSELRESRGRVNPAVEAWRESQKQVCDGCQQPNRSCEHCAECGRSGGDYCYDACLSFEKLCKKCFIRDEPEPTHHEAPLNVQAIHYKAMAHISKKNAFAYDMTAEMVKMLDQTQSYKRAFAAEMVTGMMTPAERKTWNRHPAAARKYPALPLVPSPKKRTTPVRPPPPVTPAKRARSRSPKPGEAALRPIVIPDDKGDGDDTGEEDGMPVFEAAEHGSIVKSPVPQPFPSRKERRAARAAAAEARGEK